MAYTPPAPPYFGPVSKTSGTANLPIVRIVIHATVGGAGSDAKGAQGTASYFRSALAKGSAHYICDSDETIQCAYDRVICWHAPPNSHSLGIELCCSLANKGQGHWPLANHVAMMRQGAKLTAQKCLQYGVPIRKLTVAQVKAGEKGICSHDDVSKAFGQSSHWDPGPYFPWPLFIAMVQNEANIITGTGEGQSMSAADVKQILDAMAAYQATSGNEGLRYGALQRDLDDLQVKLASFMAAENGRYARLEAIHDENLAAFAKIQTAVEKGSADEARAINSLVEAINALTAKLPEAPPPKA